MPRLLLFSCLVVTIILLSLISQQSVPAIQYFPSDTNATIIEAKTQITQRKHNAKNNLTWSIYSNSNQNAYIRQDVSLLYANGLFKGVLGKWKQNVSAIGSKQDVTIENNALIQAITFHYGETHNQDETIFSIQQMTRDQLYYIQTASPYIFKEPQTENDAGAQQTINDTINKMQTGHWEQLITHYEIDASEYTLIPLTDMFTYQSEPFPNQTMENTDKVIGQFWEGLYKKYVLLLNEKTHTHHMPIILLANDQTHLILLFELETEKHFYIQQIN